jgi:transcriptional regulator with XRE-family HTH domain
MTKNPPSNLGPQLRALRESRGWRIVDVSEKTGLAISTISKVENGKMSLTYDKLLQLAKGLGVDLAELFAGVPAKPAARPPVSGLRSVGRMEDARYIDAGFYQYWYLNTDLAHKDMTPIIGEVSARSIEEFGDLIRHPGQEFVFVLEGKIIVHTEFYQPVTLARGQTIYIDSNMGHAYLAGAKGPCRFLVVCSGGDVEGLMKAVTLQRAPATARVRKSKRKQR